MGRETNALELVGAALDRTSDLVSPGWFWLAMMVEALSPQQNARH